MLKKIKSLNYRFYIILVITIISLLFSFKFTRSYLRIVESLYDLITSFLFYFTELFRYSPLLVPSVNNVSKLDNGFIEQLFIAFETIIPYFKLSFCSMFNLDNFLNYFSYVFNLLYNFAQLLLILLPLFLLIYFKFKNYLKENDKKRNEDSKSLKLYKKLEIKIFIPTKKWIIEMIAYINSLPIFKIIWIIIWLFYFNIFTIIIEFISYYLYFVVTFDWFSLLKQLYKLILDLTPMFMFVPLIIWIIIAFKVLKYLREKRGYKLLNFKEQSNREFIESTGQLTLIDGEPGTGKTTLVTDMSISTEIMFRDRALTGLINNDLMFPFFPWVNLESYLKKMIDKNIIKGKASAKKHIKLLELGFTFKDLDLTIYKCFKRQFKKKYGFNYSNMIFDYDYEKYGLTYDDNLKINYIWDVLVTYSELYVIYITSSSLLISNYSIRVDNILQDLGNFPLWNSDLFTKSPFLSQTYSRYAHILDFDMLRLGKKMIENNEKANVFEFGILDVTEAGKERGNILDTRELKKNVLETNQKNDGFNDCLKMLRHNAMVDNYPFLKIWLDDQRAQSLGADVRELCQKVVYIRKKESFRSTLIFFDIDTMFYEYFENKFKTFYLEYRFYRSDNSLFMYLYKKLFSYIYKKYMYKYNTFGYNKLILETQRGSLNNNIEETTYFLLHKKIYSDRFCSDAFSDFFENKALRSKIGLNQLQEYRSVKATEDEFKLLNSYMINKWFEYK